MPTLAMRGRYLMREYWSDTDLFTKLTADYRELYIGLWMLCDDDGWMPRDVAGIGAALYRFLDHEPRSVLVRDGIARLVRLSKVKSYRCGCLWLPAVAKYPRAGKKSREHALNHLNHQTNSDAFKSHASNGSQTDLYPSPDPSLPDPTRRGARARGDGFKEKLAAAGGKKP
jgi:hypothetical protein